MLIPLLRRIMEEKEKGTVILSTFVRALVQGEDLDMNQYTVDLGNKVLAVHLISKVKVSSSGTARLHWLANFAGYSISKAIGSGNDLDAVMVVYEQGGGRTLWFPEWITQENPADALAMIINNNFLFKQVVKPDSGLCLRCNLRTRDKVDTLLEWQPEALPPNAPDDQLLSIMAKSHKIAGNDLIRIFTNIKLAKSGYYSVDTTGLTNVPPTLPPGSNGVKMGPMNLRELKKLESQ